MSVGAILRAVAVIIEQSKWRAEHFLSSPGIVTVFPKQIYAGFLKAILRTRQDKALGHDKGGNLEG
jgi:hypothetical protein